MDGEEGRGVGRGAAGRQFVEGGQGTYCKSNLLKNTPPPPPSGTEDRDTVA